MYERNCKCRHNSSSNYDMDTSLGSLVRRSISIYFSLTTGCRQYHFSTLQIKIEGVTLFTKESSVCYMVKIRFGASFLIPKPII